MGLLDYIYAAAQSGVGDVKKNLRGLLDDPVGTVKQKIEQIGRDNAASNNLRANAYPLPGEHTVLNSPEQIAQFRQEFANEAGNMGLGGLLGATVWHGSPHKFDKFDSSKIGTGEGAQAYGHGLYLAESPDVAKEYAQRLSKNAYVDTKPEILAASKDSSDALKKWVDATSSGANTTGLRDIAEKAAENYQKAIKDYGPQVYKVDLPDEHIAKMLNYDAPVPETIRKPLSDAAMRDFGSGMTGTSGEHLYKEAVFNFKQAGHQNPTQAATDWLSSQGIPGIRYLDGGSRSAGVGSSNYVIFPGNEGLLSILERNGQPLP